MKTTKKSKKGRSAKAKEDRKTKAKVQKVDSNLLKDQMDAILNQVGGDSDDDQVQDFGDEEIDSDEADGGGGGHGQFLSQLAAIEGAPRFLHHNEEADLHDGAISKLLGKDKITIESMVEDLAPDSAEKKKKLKKDLKKSQGPAEDLIGLTSVELKKAERSAVYAKTKKDISVWDSVVHSRRSAETVNFPVKKADLRLPTSSDYVQGFKPKTALENEVLSLLYGVKKSEGKEGENNAESPAFNFSLSEAIEKRKELARLRALQSYQESKLKRQKKIKSKSYRKILRKQKEKEKELGQKTNADDSDNEGDDNLEEKAEKIRILERATLRHRNSSKHLKDLARRAKSGKANNPNDKEIQKGINEQINLHRNLTAKKVDQAETEENEIEDEDGFVDAKFFNEAEKEEKIVDDMINDAVNTLNPWLAKIRQSQPPTVEKTSKKAENKNSSDGVKSGEEVPEKAIIDPEKFIQADKKGQLDLIEMGKANSDDDDQMDDDEDDEQAGLIKEAFANDDVVGDFMSEKKAKMDERKGKVIDMTLPGWGDWGGQDIKVSKRKRKRFTVKQRPAEKRRDDNKGFMILNDHKDTAAKEHQVKSVPFPYRSVADYEASMRAPVGDTFVPRTAFKKLTAPKVNVKKGEIIEAMDKDELVKRGKVNS